MKTRSDDPDHIPGGRRSPRQAAALERRVETALERASLFAQLILADPDTDARSAPAMLAQAVRELEDALSSQRILPFGWREPAKPEPVPELPETGLCCCRGLPEVHEFGVVGCLKGTGERPASLPPPELMPPS